MALIARLQELAPTMAAWRRDLHAHPETAFAEHRTAALVAERLASFGCEVHTGLAGTGVVGVLRAGAGKAGASQDGTDMAGSSARSIGLRADMDALPITEFHGGEAWNVIPARVVLRGSLRYFRDEVRHTIHGRMQSLCAGVAAAHGAQAELRILPGYPPTVNSAAEAATAAAAMAAVVGAERVDTHLPPTMGAEDFAYMLQARPGAYGWIGNGPGTGGCLLHNPRYDFNDALLAIGASYWATLVERELVA